MGSLVEDIRVIDTDSHVVEPADLWTSRVAAKWGDLVPHVLWDDKAGEDAWFIGDERVAPASSAAQAGWREYPPDHPPRLSEAEPETWEVNQRLAYMDRMGIHAQALYPNVAMFNANRLASLVDQDLQLAVVRAYNDWQTEWSAPAPDRLLPMASLPFWDIDATVAEMARCAEAGHRGVVFTQDPAFFGQPMLADRHWDPMWSAAEQLGLPINFHIGSSDTALLATTGHPDSGKHANYASIGVSFFMGNARTLAQLICSGICHRFPDLKFVSVESGIGWIPFAMDALDWQWDNCGVAVEHPEYDLRPSEYFRRQIFGCFWFERAALPYAIERLGPDNILYETDFPHPTSMSPGPATSAIEPKAFIEEVFAGIDRVDARKILHDNAARLYRLD